MKGSDRITAQEYSLLGVVWRADNEVCVFAFCNGTDLAVRTGQLRRHIRNADQAAAAVVQNIETVKIRGLQIRTNAFKNIPGRGSSCSMSACTCLGISAGDSV